MDTLGLDSISTFLINGNGDKKFIIFYVVVLATLRVGSGIHC